MVVYLFWLSISLIFTQFTIVVSMFTMLLTCSIFVALLLFVQGHVMKSFVTSQLPFLISPGDDVDAVVEPTSGYSYEVATE